MIKNQASALSRLMSRTLGPAPLEALGRGGVPQVGFGRWRFEGSGLDRRFDLKPLNLVVWVSQESVVSETL